MGVSSDDRWFSSNLGGGFLNSLQASHDGCRAFLEGFTGLAKAILGFSKMFYGFPEPF
jgi:hypothetical protein